MQDFEETAVVTSATAEVTACLIKTHNATADHTRIELSDVAHYSQQKKRKITKTRTQKIWHRKQPRNTTTQHTTQHNTIPHHTTQQNTTKQHNTTHNTQQTTNNKQQTTTNKQKTTNNKQQTNKKQHTTHKKKHTKNKHNKQKHTKTHNKTHTHTYSNTYLQRITVQQFVTQRVIDGQTCIRLDLSLI